MINDDIYYNIELVVPWIAFEGVGDLKSNESLRGPKKLSNISSETHFGDSVNKQL